MRAEGCGTHWRVMPVGCQWERDTVGALGVAPVGWEGATVGVVDQGIALVGWRSTVGGWPSHPFDGRGRGCGEHIGRCAR